jgi:hypothetical protein
MQFCLALVLLTLFVSTLSSCGDDRAADNSRKIQRIFVHGNPETELLRGTTSNAVSFLHERTIPALDGFDFSSGIVLREFTAFTESEQKSGDEKTNQRLNSAIERAVQITDRPSGLSLFNWRQSLVRPSATTDLVGQSWDSERSEGPTTWEYVDTTSGLIALRARKEASGVLEVAEILGIPVTMIHYSISSDKRTMSFLGKASDPVSGTTLLVVSFSQRYRNGPGASRSTELFNFVGGKGIKYRWNARPITLSLCLPDPKQTARVGADTRRREPVVDLVQQAWNAWTDGGSGGSGLLREHQAKLLIRNQNIPPFSDVNVHCLYSVPDYAHESSNELLTSGLTLPMVNHSLGTIETAGVFLFERAIARVPGERSYLSTAIHEIGHFLGLGHEFDKGPDGRFKYLSAMGYFENRTVFPSPRDRAAIKELYGKVEPGPQRSDLPQ